MLETKKKKTQPKIIKNSQINEHHVPRTVRFINPFLALSAYIPVGLTRSRLDSLTYPRQRRLQHYGQLFQSAVLRLGGEPAIHQGHYRLEVLPSAKRR